MLYVYGERPITELFILLSSESVLLSFISQVQLEDGSRIDTSEERVEAAFIEAPLGGDIGYADFVIMTTSLCIIFEVKPDEFLKVRDRLAKQILRYCRCLDKTDTSSSAGLVKKFYGCKEGKKTHLVIVTGDRNRPSDLSSLLDDSVFDKTSIGWAPYKPICDELKNKGYNIPEGPPHTWAEGKWELAIRGALR